MESLSPRDHGEQVAVFRYGLLGQLVSRPLDHGELAAELRRLSQQRVRPPGSDTTRTYAPPTLERWLYAYKKGGLAALAPRARTDRGRGRDLDPVLRDLLCDIRREHPDVSVTLIVRTLHAEGRVGPEVKVCTVRRMYAEKGLTRVAAADGRARRRAFAGRPTDRARSGTATSAMAPRSLSTAAALPCASMRCSMMPLATSSPFASPRTSGKRRCCPSSRRR